MRKSLPRQLSLLGLALSLILTLTFGLKTSTVATPTAQIGTPYHVCTRELPLKLRDKPSLQASTELGVFPKHTEVRFLRFASNKDWSLVQVPTGAQGYMASRYLCAGPTPVVDTKIGEPTLPTYEDSTRVVCTKGSPLNVREHPNLNKGPITKVNNGNTVTLSAVSFDKGWAYTTQTEPAGWLSTDYLCPIIQTRGE